MADKYVSIPKNFIVIFSIGLVMSYIVKFQISKPRTTSLLLPKDIADKFHDDPETIKLASSDYGLMVKKIPAKVFHPTSVNDIASLLNFTYNYYKNSSVPFNIAARGLGGTTRGQSLVPNGVVINMTSLDKSRINVSGILVSSSPSLGYYADVGAELLWIDVLHATLEHGLTPVSWTDYLYLTVGGTLSQGGISGQAFRFGPQISNVYEMDVITGKGDFVTCSEKENSELYYAVLGGLGQFGIITRARIALEPAPKMAKWIRVFYNEFSAFTRDQERLISINGRNQINALDYVEGLVIMNRGNPFQVFTFPESDQSRIISLLNKHGIIYYIEIAKYYDDHTQNTVEKELQLLLKELSFLPEFVYEKDVSRVDFLNRVKSEELFLRSILQWEVPHPWFELLIPKSRIFDFHSGVFEEIIMKQNIPGGLILVFPMNRNKWDDNMSAVVPDEDVFYLVSLLRSSDFNDWGEALEYQNEEIHQFCDKVGIKARMYQPHYKTQEEWILKHFGSRWESFRERKARFDPKMILAPGHNIFKKN